MGSKHITSASGKAIQSFLFTDLTTISRLTQPVADPQPLSFWSVLQEAFGNVNTDDLVCTVETDTEIWADKVRLSELFQNIVRLALATDSSELVARSTDDGFVIRMNGDSLLEGDAEKLFNYGTAVPHADAGMLGPNIRSLAQAHGWDVTAYTPDSGGIALTVSGATLSDFAVKNTGGE